MSGNRRFLLSTGGGGTSDDDGGGEVGSNSQQVSSRRPRGMDDGSGAVGTNPRDTPPMSRSAGQPRRRRGPPTASDDEEELEEPRRQRGAPQQPDVQQGGFADAVVGAIESKADNLRNIGRDIQQRGEGIIRDVKETAGEGARAVVGDPNEDADVRERAEGGDVGAQAYEYGEGLGERSARDVSPLTRLGTSRDDQTPDAREGERVRFEVARPGRPDTTGDRKRVDVERQGRPDTTYESEVDTGRPSRPDTIYESEIEADPSPAARGERDIARQAQQGNIAAAGFQFGEAITRIGTDVRRRVTGAVAPTVEAIPGGDIEVGEAEFDDQVASGLGMAAEGPFLIGGGIVQGAGAAGLATERAARRGVDLDDIDRGVEEVSDRAIVATGRMATTAASRPVETAVALGAPVAAGRGIGRGSRFARSDRSIGDVASDVGGRARAARIEASRRLRLREFREDIRAQQGRSRGREIREGDVEAADPNEVITGEDLDVNPRRTDPGRVRPPREDVGDRPTFQRRRARRIRDDDLGTPADRGRDIAFERGRGRREVREQAPTEDLRSVADLEARVARELAADGPQTARDLDPGATSDVTGAAAGTGVAGAVGADATDTAELDMAGAGAREIGPPDVGEDLRSPPTDEMDIADADRQQLAGTGPAPTDPGAAIDARTVGGLAAIDPVGGATRPTGRTTGGDTAITRLQRSAQTQGTDLEAGAGQPGGDPLADMTDDAIALVDDVAGDAAGRPATTGRARSRPTATGTATRPGLRTDVRGATRTNVDTGTTADTGTDINTDLGLPEYRGPIPDTTPRSEIIPEPTDITTPDTRTTTDVTDPPAPDPPRTTTDVTDPPAPDPPRTTTDFGDPNFAEPDTGRQRVPWTFPDVPLGGGDYPQRSFESLYSVETLNPVVAPSEFDEREDELLGLSSTSTREPLFAGLGDAGFGGFSGGAFTEPNSDPSSVESVADSYGAGEVLNR